MKENTMNEETFNELVNSFEYVATLTEYGRKNIKYHIQRLQQENKQQSEKIGKLEDNWNELKEYIKETKLKEVEKEFGTRYAKTFTQVEAVCNMILNTIQELEQGSDNNGKYYGIN